MPNSNDLIVWVDCEMTGLSLEKDELIEIAVIVTDGQLNEMDQGLDLIIKPSQKSLDSMIEIVKEMHTASGLLAELDQGIDLKTAEAEVLKYVKQHVPEERKAPLAGSSVYVDRGFIARDLPSFDAHLHYRLIDVSSIKELTKRWYPKVYFAAPEKTGNHRALADIKESIAELRYFREAIMVPPPGPGSDIAQELASRFVIEH
ncbi:MAG: oligoribonuclease [Candidatus Nanopelagicales bacterium]